MAAGDYPALARARYAQIVLAVVAMFGTMDQMLVSVLLEPMKRDLGLTDVGVGMAHTTAYYAAYGLAAIPMGMLADRLARVRLLLIAILLLCASLALVGLSHSIWPFAGAKAVMGVANALFYPAALSLLADSFAPERRAFATATYPMGQAVGSGAALLIGGSLYSALVARAAADPAVLAGISPWRAVSLVFGAAGLVLMPAILAIREPGRHEVRESGAGSFRELWAYRAFLIPLFAGMMALTGMNMAIQIWFAPALIRLYGLQPGDFALSSSLVVLGAGLCGLLLSSKLINLTRARGDEQAAMSIAAIAALCCIPGCFLATMPSLIAFAGLGLLFLLAGGIAIAVPVIVINFRLPNELRGLTMGLYIVLISLAGMVGAPLTGFVGQRLGGDAMLGWAMASVGVPCALFAALSFWAASRGRPAAEIDPVMRGT